MRPAIAQYVHVTCVLLVIILMLWWCIPGSLVPSEGGTCSLPGCNRPKYVDPANNRTHDFCGRTHAFLAQKQGNGVIIVLSVLLVRLFIKKQVY